MNSEKKEVYLDHIGLVEDSKIVLDGLTVVTGHNNSGKTTVGKAIYSVLAAVDNLELDAYKDKISYVGSECRRLRDILGIRNRIYFMRREKADEKSDYECLRFFLESGLPNQIDNISELIQYLHRIMEETRAISDDELDQLVYGKNMRDNESRNARITKRLILETMQTLEQNLGQDGELTQYASRKIIKTLLMEFNDQILPVKYPEKTGKLSMRSKDYKYFSIPIEHNDILTEEPVYFNRSYYNSVFIDDVFVLDRIKEKKRLLSFYFNDEMKDGDWMDGGRIVNHNISLENKLEKESDSVFEEILNKENTKMLLEKIEKVFPDRITPFEGRYVCGQSKLDVRNLATGSKLFAIIKRLLENQEISEGTLLILDEPESHLHPTWQNQFAEIIVLMIKCLNMDVLLTTHSPNFLMALEVYSKKYDMWEHTNMYCTEVNADTGLIHYEDVRDNIKKAYMKLADPLFELQAMNLKNGE